jgi:hypothetical protein
MRLLTGIRLISCSACDSEMGCLTDSIGGGDAYGKLKQLLRLRVAGD